MAYVLGQYNKNKTVPEDNIFMSYIDVGEQRRREVPSDSGVSGLNSTFQDECCYVSSGFSIAKNYYFHGKIKRMLSPQTFTIKLVNYNQEGRTDVVEQYIKTIAIGGGDLHEWVDIEFIFTPLVVFDTILFELQRTVEDYRDEIRYPIIIYQELSQIENLISTKIGIGTQLIKIGVQSHPGLMMCINGEEIHTPRSGVYELKNGVILVSFFSIVTAAKEDTNLLINKMNSINDQVDQIIADYEAGIITKEEAERRKSLIRSECFFNTGIYPKTRTIDSFTMDYMYKEE